MGKCLFLSLELLFPIFLFVDRQALCISLLGSFSQHIDHYIKQALSANFTNI